MRRILQLALAAALVCATAACGPLGPGSITVTAHFQDAAGLFEGNDVGILGVQVGKVTSIEPEGRGVKVTFTVDSDVPVPADVDAVVVSRSVATDRYVELTPTYHQGPKLGDGADIPLDRTRTPVDFDEVLDSVNTFAKGIAGSGKTSQAIARFLRVSAENFGPNGPTMNEAITNLGSAVDSVSKQSENITSTMGSLDTLTGKLVANQQVVREFLRSTAETTQLLAAERRNFRDALTTLSQATELVARFAARNKAKLKGTLADATAVADILLSRKPQVEEFLEKMPLVVQNLNRIKDPDGVLLRVPISQMIGGSSLQTICSQLPVSLCELVGGEPTGPLQDLLGGLLGTGATP